MKNKPSGNLPKRRYACNIVQQASGTMTNLRQLVALNIKRTRQGLGISQSALAERARASTQYIAMIETGRKFPSIEMLERLAAALGNFLPV